MRENRLSIRIDRPVNEVFEFTINPENTPLWVPGMAEEQASEWPVRKGTAYRNRGKGNEWDEYAVSQVEQDKVFELRAADGRYHVRYSYVPLGNQATEMEYYEWVEQGELEHPFTEATLQKLKSILEAE